MADEIRLTIRKVDNQYADTPVQVTFATVSGTEAVKPEELVALLHRHGVFEYHLQESRGITNWGASAEIQNLVLTMAAAATPQIVGAIIQWLRSRAPRQTLHGGAEAAETFLKQHFGPHGSLVCDDVRQVEGGTQMRFHDDSSVYEVFRSLDGNLKQASRIIPQGQRPHLLRRRRFGRPKPRNCSQSQTSCVARRAKSGVATRPACG